MHNKIHSIKVNSLTTLPKKVYSEPKSSITFGDMHANALSMLYKLVSTGIVKISKDQYERIVSAYMKIYLIPNLKDRYERVMGKYLMLIDKLIPCLNSDYINVNKAIKIFDKVINNLEAGDNSHLLVRFLGDLLADRGSSDYFILKIIKKLQQLGIEYEITLSNHDIEFINSYFNKFIKVTNDNSACGFIIDKMLFSSLYNLHFLIENNFIKKGEVNSIVKDIYLKKIKLISYECCNACKNIKIYTHAPISLEKIIEYAVKMGLAESITKEDTTLEYVKALLDELNNYLQKNLANENKFKEFVKQFKFDNEVWLKDPDNFFNNQSSFKNIFQHTAYSYDCKLKKEVNYKFSVNYCHGHVGCWCSENDYQQNLDSNLGKSFWPGESISGKFFVESNYDCNLSLKKTEEKNRLHKTSINSQETEKTEEKNRLHKTPTKKIEFWSSLKKKLKKEDLGETLGRAVGEICGLAALGVTFFGGKSKVKRAAKLSVEFQKKGGFWNSWLSGFLNGSFGVHDAINVADLPIKFLTRYEKTRIKELKKKFVSKIG